MANDDSIEWFRRLADIPGVGYAGSPGVDRARLAGRDEVPRIIAYDFDGHRRRSLQWSLQGGSTTASPAQRHGLQAPREDQTLEAVLRRMHEAIEVPGQASDYHFAIQGCLQSLWQRRAEAPAMLDQFEQLCWLDIRLIEARPAIIQFERDGKVEFARVLGVEYLARLYERNGYLAEALEVAQRLRSLGQGIADIDGLRARLTLVEAER
jgi:hypothetical protein